MQWGAMEAAWRQEGEDMMERGEMGCNGGCMEARGSRHDGKG